jgi:hypothetical protein
MAKLGLFDDVVVDVGLLVALFDEFSSAFSFALQFL